MCHAGVDRDAAINRKDNKMVMALHKQARTTPAVRAVLLGAGSLPAAPRRERPEQATRARGKAQHKPFKAYEPGYMHVDVKYLPPTASRSVPHYEDWTERLSDETGQ
jgi:hypothetical protein